MRRLCAHTIQLLIGLVWLAGTARGAIPENDNFAARLMLAGPNVSASGSNVGATREIGEPDPNFTGGRSVWWTWTAPTDGYLTITTAGSSFDTMLTVFTGTVVTNLTLVAFNDTEDDTSAVSFNVTAGTGYQIAVDGTDNEYIPVNDARGSIALQLTLGAPQPPPANDHFANRHPLAGSSINNITGSNLGATREPGEPFHADAIGQKSVWWTWTAPASGGLTLNSHGSAIDTMMAIYTGDSVGNLTLVAANDEDPDAGSESTVTCNVVSGVPYQIVVDGFEGDAGNLKFSLDLDAAFPVPANDNFANRIPITGSSVTTNVSNIGATYEPGEPMHLGIFGGKTVWFRWTAPSSGGVTLTVSNNMLDTLVAVYTGTTLGNLAFVAGNDEDYFLSEFLDGDSTAYFNAANGTTYIIAVDGADGNWGNFRLRLTMGQSDSAPGNNNFASSTLITGTNTTVNGSNLGATLEAGEPLHRGYYGGSSVWWRWVSPGPGIVTIDTSNNIVDAPDTLLAVYTGSSVSTLTEIASDNNSGGANWTSLVSFPTKSNVTYRVAVDGYDGDAWNNIKVRVRFGLAAYSLTVNTNPPGAGVVTLSPPPDQGGKYAPGTVVKVTATPAGGGSFYGWTGDLVSTNNPIVLAMISNRTVTASFSAVSGPKVWTGANAGGGNWTSSGNWSGGTPVAGDELVFPAGAARLTSNTNDFATNTTFKSITFGAGGYLLRGNPVALSDGIAATNTSGTNTLSLAILLTGNQTFRCSAAAAGLLISGNITLGGNTLTNDTTGPVWLGGQISGTGGLVKQGTGRLTLSGANTYTGQSTINGGQLIVNGSQSSSAVVVNASGTLGGAGQVGNLSGAGTISPGSSPGTLSSGSVTLAANTTFRVELNGTSAGPGYDQLNVGGTVSLAGTLNATLGFTPAINDSFTIVDNNGTDSVVGTFTGLPQGSHLVFGGVLLQISYSSGAGANNVVLTRVSPAPPNISSLTKLANGAAQVLGNGQAGLSYVLETATTLTPPVAWTPVRTNIAAANGDYQLIHSNAFTLPTRFYRVRWP